MKGPEHWNNWISSLSDEEIEFLPFAWEDFWARRNQIPPDGNWFISMMLGGRGGGKTRGGAEWIRKRVESGTAERIALVARSPADARDVLIEGNSGILSISRPEYRPKYEPSKRSLTWPRHWKTGVIPQAIVFSSYEPDQLRGPQFDTAWCDELAAWDKIDETWSNLMLGLRLNDPRCLVTTTPRPIPIIKELDLDKSVIKLKGSTLDNINNLDINYIQTMLKMYGTESRLGRQELFGEILGDVEGALWKQEWIDRNRISWNNLGEEQDSFYAFKMKWVEKMVRIVIAVDPATSNNRSTSDETGIMVVGVDGNEEGYLIEDRTMHGSPLEWARQVVVAYREFKADVIVVEVNQGGDMVETTIRQIDPNVPIKKVIASKGKVTRAEPVSTLYEINRIHHIGDYRELEEQLISWTPRQDSPDRLDALVWGISELMVEGGKSIFKTIDPAQGQFSMSELTKGMLFNRSDTRLMFERDNRSFWR